MRCSVVVPVRVCVCVRDMTDLIPTSCNASWATLLDLLRYVVNFEIMLV